MNQPLMNRLLLTGAAGGLGRALRARLAPLARTIRLADIAPIADPAPHEEIVTCDLADAGAVDRMVQGCDGIVHFGGVSVEMPFPPILQANILGLYNLYEAARRHGQPRILFASSNHTVGFWKQTDRLGPDTTLRPDSLYGVSKVFGEALARMYFEKFGQETALVRVGSATPAPEDHRMLASWLSHDDLLSLIEAVFRVERLGCPVIWGASANTQGWWDNSHLDWLGWTPRDNAETFRAKIEATVPRPAPDEAVALYQGGIFTEYPIYQEKDA
ncbi:NAD(P)-dependent oxidoreductase [Paracoccus sp. MA]|uniref:NAD-dependent epimerase/dehydratase family protein n=1 Tax=Paracoccus sp. MA TaxID=2895796 RepID=UPI001E412C04|nr:NAD(P)-dependent oxidoreductase [Paracoccus sp. MA]UFM64181.1 NAD(P)-dependent oxidoreductase [Paracoccus sp. MA]